MITFEQWEAQYGDDAMIYAAESGMDREASFSRLAYLEGCYERHIRYVALQDLKDKVRGKVLEMASEVAGHIQKLDRAGAGIIDEHIKALEEGQDYRMANLVLLAILDHYDNQIHVTSKTAQEVVNLIRLL